MSDKRKRKFRLDDIDSNSVIVEDSLNVKDYVDSISTYELKKDTKSDTKISVERNFETPSKIEISAYSQIISSVSDSDEVSLFVIGTNDSDVLMSLPSQIEWNVLCGPIPGEISGGYINVSNSVSFVFDISSFTGSKSEYLINSSLFRYALFVWCVGSVTNYHFIYDPANSVVDMKTISKITFLGRK